jgi:spore maturation protein CgeB
LRIFFIAPGSDPDSMEKHVSETLIAMGHEVRQYGSNGPSGRSTRIGRVAKYVSRTVFREPERLGERGLLRALAEFAPDLVLVLLGNMLSPKTMELMRKQYSGKVVCWCQDSVTTMGRQYLIGCGYDKVFVKDHYLVDMFRDYLGMDVHYLPEACNPQYHRNVALTDQDRERYSADICTFGNIYYYRQNLLESLSSYNLQVWGNRPSWLVDRLGGRFQGRPIFETEKCKAVAGAKIVLNNLHFAEIRSLNCRAFEVAGCGGFQLISYSAAIEEHFKIGEQIEVFHNRSELIEKVNYYLANQHRARTIAAAGNVRAHAEHTYRHRLVELLRVSGY